MKRFFLALLLASIPAAVVYAQPHGMGDNVPEARTGLPVWHSGFNDAAATTVVRTFIGAAGASTRNTSVITATGKVGTAFDFYAGGTDDSVDTGVSCNIGNTNFSMCAWLQPDGAGESSSGKIFDCGNSRGVFLCGAGANICFTYGTQIVSTATILETGAVWTHLCVTHTAAGAGIIYLNGALDKAAANGTSGNAANFLIGNNSLADRAFNGRIDDVRIYNKVLTADQVKWLYNGGAGRGDS